MTNELAYNDREIGSLVEALKTLELYDDTLLLVTADHGEEFGEHEFTRHGKTLFREALHIPGILKLPHSERAGVRIPSLVGNIDLAPSLLALAGLPVTPRLRRKRNHPERDPPTNPFRCTTSDSSTRGRASMFSSNR